MQDMDAVKFLENLIALGVETEDVLVVALLILKGEAEVVNNYGELRLMRVQEKPNTDIPF